jgi:hypothetical protein
MSRHYGNRHNLLTSLHIVFILRPLNGQKGIFEYVVTTPPVSTMVGLAKDKLGRIWKKVVVR